MIGITATIEGSLLAELDIFDAKVRKATKEAVAAVAFDAYTNITTNIQEKGLIKTGNLLKSVGFNVQGGGKYNIINYNYTPQRSGRRKMVLDAPLEAPPPSSNRNEANVFVLARYAIYLETGTYKMAARPFFWSAISQTHTNTYSIVIAVFEKNGIGV